ncbi:MAG: hypothetical protein ACOX4U_08605 [Anaerovoracaceae bacterium]|jgi:hypothetical protein
MIRRRRGYRRKGGPIMGTYRGKIFGLLLALAGGWIVVYTVPLWVWYMALALSMAALVAVLIYN